MFSQRNKVQTRKSAATGRGGKTRCKNTTKNSYIYIRTHLDLYNVYVHIKHPFVVRRGHYCCCCYCYYYYYYYDIISFAVCACVFILPKTGDYYWLSVRVPSTGVRHNGCYWKKKKRRKRTVIYGRTPLTRVGYAHMCARLKTVNWNSINKKKFFFLTRDCRRSDSV